MSNPVHKHKTQVTLDDESGDLVVIHRCTVELAGHFVSHAEMIDLSDNGPLVAVLKDIIDANREAMETRAAENAIEHVAAVKNQERKGVKRIALGGSVGAVGVGTVSVKPKE